MGEAESAFIIWVASHANERGHNRYTQDEKAMWFAAYRAGQADAWDKGYASGRSNAMRYMSDEPNAPSTPNPYRLGDDRG